MKDLPPGFAEDSPSGVAPSASAAATEGGKPLPEGFKEDAPSPTGAKAPQPSSSLDYNIDRFKKGVAGVAALPALGVDLIQAGLDKEADLINATGKVGSYIKEKVTGVSPEAKDSAKKWFIGNDPEKENVGGYKQVKRGIETLLRGDKLLQGKDTKDVPIPTDLFGKPSKVNEYTGEIMEFLGGALIPGIGPVVNAQRKLLVAMTEIGGATLSGASSVEGKELGESMGPTFGLTREQGGQVGQILGAVAGPKLLQTAAQHIDKTLQRAESGAEFVKEQGFLGGRSAESQKAAAEVLKNKELREALALNPSSPENLARAAEVTKRMEGFQPGIAQASGAPGLIAMQKQVSQSSPEALAKAAAMDDRNRSAIQKFTDKFFPASKQPVNEAARVRAATMESQNRQDMLNVERELTALGDKYARDVDKGATGQALRDLYWQRRGEVKGKLNTQIDEVYKMADTAGLKTEMSDVVEATKKVLGSDKESFQNAPPLLKDILTEFNPPKPPPTPLPAPVQSRGSSVGIRRAGPAEAPKEAPNPTEASFEKMHSLWRQANREWMDYTAAGKLDEARKVSMVKDLLQKKLDKFNSPEYGPIGDKFRAFNKDYTQYSKVFKEGAGNSMSNLTRKGYSVDAEDIVNKAFLQAGDKKKGIQDFFHIYGQDEKAAKLLHDGITDNYSRSVVDAHTGDFNPRAARAWMKRNEQAMSELPQLKAKLQQETDVGGALVQRRAELNAQRRIYDKSVMKSAAQAQNPEHLVEAGMRDPRMFKALLASAKTPESKQSLARSIVDMTLQNHKGSESSFKFVQDNERVLKPVMDALGKDHWSNLKTLAEADMIANRVKAPKGVELSKAQDPIASVLGVSGPGLLSRSLNVAKGYMSKSYAVADVAGRVYYKIRTEELARLREEAMFDPDIASALAKVVKKERPASKDLMDMKALAFQAGISISSHGVSRTSEREDRRKAGLLPEETAAAARDEGRGKWHK